MVQCIVVRSPSIPGGREEEGYKNSFRQTDDTALTCEIPTPCCQGDRLVWSWASGRCSGNGRRGCTRPRLRCTPRWWLRLGWPDTQCLHTHTHKQWHHHHNTVGGSLTQVHNVVTTDGTVVNHNICGGEKDSEELHDSYICLPHAHRATAFHYKARTFTIKSQATPSRYLFHFKSLLISNNWSGINIHSFSHL